jgi:hypothetical protein
VTVLPDIQQLPFDHTSLSLFDFWHSGTRCFHRNRVVFGISGHFAMSQSHFAMRRRVAVRPITQTARLERVKEFSSVAVRARHITTAPTARSTCRCLDTECCARSVRIARTVADSGPSVASTRSTSHRTGLPSARNKFTMSTSDPAAAGAAVVCAPSALTPCQQALVAETTHYLTPGFDRSCPKYGLFSAYNDSLRASYIPSSAYNDPLRAKNRSSCACNRLSGTRQQLIPNLQQPGGSRQIAGHDDGKTVFAVGRAFPRTGVHGSGGRILRKPFRALNP